MPVTPSCLMHCLREQYGLSNVSQYFFYISSPVDSYCYGKHSGRDDTPMGKPSMGSSSKGPKPAVDRDQ